MELPEFDGAGTGPQGVSGVNPRSLDEAQRIAQETVGNEPRPEDSPGVREIIDREIERASPPLGTDQPQQQVESERAQAAPQPQARPATAAPDAPSGPQEEAGLRDRLREIRKKYGGSFVELAKAHVQTEQTAEERLIASERENERLRTLATQPGYQPPPQPRPQAQQQDDRLPEWDWSNPAAHLARREEIQLKRFEKIVQDNLMAFAQAQGRQQGESRYSQIVRDRAEEIRVLDPVMRQIRSSHMAFYEGMPSDAVLEDLLERAHDRVGRQGYESLSMELQSLDAGGAPAATGAPNPGAQIRTGSGGGAARARTTPANGDLSKTRAFDALMKSRSDSVDETRNITEVLRERGFYE